MDSALLLLADSRLPSGAHIHSGGLEPAVTAGLVTDEPTLASFLAGRLATTGLVTAALAATASQLPNWGKDFRSVSAGQLQNPFPQFDGGAGVWDVLDAETDARTPSAAQRAASRAQGRGLVRVARTAWPSPLFDEPALARRDGPHHPIALGVCVHVAGGGPYDAALLAATAAVTGPATAAVRMLGLDPMGVQAVLAALAPRIDAVAAQATDLATGAADAGRPADAANPPGPLAGLAALPAPSAPLLDILAEHHLTQEVRLFES